ncbi:tyrosine-type recombinase/integrase (plasmid) [Rhodococcus sp. USK10]|uniref:site-specific integrase n=1 Tax=Rhodococcus sp. USK10 TaxID=2789739 RepID=UPI001C5EC082|nr:site-specific integrase [Rhodococcus sp. USK10]QYB00300.1 tyrosine-type recombinase/integrase [Rhodococcus sp. USK10]
MTRTSTRRKPGRMGPFIEGYRTWLLGLGYTRGSVVNMLAIAGDLGRWMDVRDLAPDGLDRVVVAQFRSACRDAGMHCAPGPRGLDPLLNYLEHVGVLVGAAATATPVEELVEHYRSWLVADRRLADATVVRYAKLARSFLSQRVTEDSGWVGSLTGADVVAFLLRESGRLSVGSTKGRVAELRSLLKFLYLAGLTPQPLATALPPVAGWHDTGVPKAIAAADVQRLLDTCDRTDPTGIRDFAILTLVARLGLRSVEVARLELSDINWRTGQIILRGKVSREDGMPLPRDVGEALAAYLAQARPEVRLHQIFVTCKAPRRAITPGLVSDVTHRACDRAGLPRVGAHRLRHSLATEMLRRGATLVEVSQVLRHRDLATTAIYAKVDFDTLRTIAAPWPGGAR